MEIKGNFQQQLETKSGTSAKGTWEATIFMIEVPGQYTKHPVFELFNNQDAIEGLRPGQPITVHFDLDSSEWNGKHFPKVKAFKVVREVVQSAPAQSVQQQYLADANQGGGPPLPNTSGAKDDLPF